MWVQLQKKAEELGVDFAGTAMIGDYLPENLKSMPYSLTIGVRLLDGIIDEVKNGATHTYFHHYRTVNAFIDQCTLQLAFVLKRAGYRALCVPASQTVEEDRIAGLVSHKLAAAEAGLGFIGRHCLFISRNFGSRVRLGTVLTDCPLPLGTRMKDGCLDCNKCVRACPSGALYGVSWSADQSREERMDARKCSVYMKEANKDIGRGAVCGICMAVCPMMTR